MPPRPLIASPPEEIESFLASYPLAVARHAHVLRELMKRTVPTAVERLRPGWRLVGYDLPLTSHGTYFAWIWPEGEHVHFGFEVGTLMNDPDGVLRGAHLRLKKVRYFTFAPGDKIPRRRVVWFIREAVRVASMSRGERQLLALTRRAGNSP